MSDRQRVYAAAGLRGCAVGLCGVVLGLHLASRGLSTAALGLVVALGLAGNALGTLAATLFADRFGRRRTLAAISALMAAGGLGLAFARHPGALAAAAFLGLANGMGRDRGPAITVEQAVLPATTTDRGRTGSFARYNVAADAGHAAGALLGGLPALLRGGPGLDAAAAYAWTWTLYAALACAAGALALTLSPAVESRAPRAKPPPLTPATRRIVTRFAALSAMDSLGGGFLTSALVGYWFFQRFGVDEATLGPLFFGARVMNGLSHLGAAWLAARIGLVRTMVFTHLPSSLMLMTLPIVPSLPAAIALFLLRESLVEMDVPTRQSYIVAVVGEQERTRAAGITNLTRNASWTVGPGAAGVLMASLGQGAPLVIGPALKVIYDLLLYRAFRHVKPPEEA